METRLVAGQPWPGPTSILALEEGEEPNSGSGSRQVAKAKARGVSLLQCSYYSTARINGEGDAAAILSKAAQAFCENGSDTTR